MTLEKLEKADLRPQTSEKTVLLEAKGLTRRFGGLIAVNDVSFSVQVGEIFG
ncbi:MAG: high-affinity branched-chain amino acid ABC transporter ATP-binding protein LivG, partial [Pseudopedobacter sp.]|nr:high-affinity branched-chain amino acid ABC transporter ATP-binding protein LivG [Deinococcales bacterium]